MKEGRGTFRVLKGYEAEFAEAWSAQAGDRLRFERRPTAWPGWIWCTAADGTSRWVPERWVTLEREACVLMCDYTATELTVQAGDRLTVERVESGWAWAATEHGRQGWVPLDCLVLHAPGEDRVAVPAVEQAPAQPAELTGTIVPLVTPFAADGSFAAAAMAHLIAFVLKQGADALMPTALTGEGLLLDLDETLAVWDVVLDGAAGRVPVVPAVIATTTRRAVRLARAAEERGAAALMVAPVLPELYAGRSHGDVVAFYADVAAAASLPLILFNYPSLTGVDLVPELVARLAEIGAVRYIKESTGDVRRVHALQRQVGDTLSVICGAPNTALESLALGCRAWITGIMNAVPRSAQQLVHAVCDQGDLALARRIYFGQILPLVDVMARNNNPTGTIKAAVCARGVDVGVPRRPGSDVSPADQKALGWLMAGIERTEAKVAQALETPGGSAGG
jgi:4-hydroxy-tetrahydrodipicolinate synthase